ncbi:MAG: CBS domain-containing protein [Saprospiraceae bacterium]|nr:CBS domain-containing protein [Saprospiraceae bacterium]MCF8251125.1 CBS domain-containing protein [Saprospiraceae bacterium]MCF8282963.1 CBS domain-containing protein [Bacteroidales bacterium]MCF8312917.1 CBS domain-containing protein [Saprospiraceae bacterium]MCF8441384.1 CBS domain-containing protein [Saprospiraceae bacterium]
MNIKIADIMHKSVVTTVPHKSLGHVRDIMANNHISSVPVVNSENEVVGIITISDLVKGHDDGTPVSKIMPTQVFSVPAYSDVHVAARIMRNHHIHHLVVTHENEIVGVLSSFDLLQLVEDHRFVYKNPPSDDKRGNKRG